MSKIIYPYILLAFAIKEMTTSEVDENFAIPVWTKWTEFHRMSDVDFTLNEAYDQESGCRCRQLPHIWLTCYGSESCKKFPRRVVITTETMKLRNTIVEGLRRGDLANATGLTYLEIEVNYNLNFIESGSFSGMINLRNLSISFNPKLVTLQVDSFKGLVNLKELFLIQNGFLRVSDVTKALGPKYLPNLSKLKLNENKFPIIGKDEFESMNGSPLKVLGLVLCLIEYIHPESLAPLSSLTTLRLGENQFNSTVIADLIMTSTEYGIPLDRLNLYSMSFKKTPPKDLMRSIAGSNISILSLSRNQFEELNDESFPDEMPNLVQLDLRDITAVNITKGTFKRMTNLKILLLSQNKLSAVPEGALLPNLSYLDLSGNSNKFTPSHFTLDKNKFKDMKNLWGLNLSFNNIHVLFNYSFVGLTNLKVLGLRHSFLYFIGDETFVSLKNLIFLDLEHNMFPRTSNMTKNTFYGLDNLEVLLLGDCEIKTLRGDIFQHLKSLKHISLERNLLKTLPETIFESMPDLYRVNLHRNELTAWSERLFRKNRNLTQLILAQNKITNLTKAMARDFLQLDSLDLTQNPLSCNCALYHTIFASPSSAGDVNVTINGNAVVIKNTPLLELLMDNDKAPFCVFPEEYSNLTIADYYEFANQNELCPTPVAAIFVFGIPVLLSAIVLLVGLLLTYKYRWHIRYWMFLTKLSLIRHGKIRTKSSTTPNHNYLYDAFVSYSTEDRNFVVRLVAMLENHEPFFKLCVYERDFEIGSIITENVLESVGKSRKTLLVISNSYVKSHWCQWEAQVAENHRLFFENEFGDLVNDSIVIIKLGNVSSKHMTPMLRYLMKTHIYLAWDSDREKQRAFWDKLRKALAPPIGKTS